MIGSMLAIGLSYIANVGMGIFGWAVFLSFLYLLGMSLLPEKQDKCLGVASFVGVVGAAFAVLWYYCGIAWNIPFPELTKALICLVSALILLRRKKFYRAGLLAPAALHVMAKWLGLFSLFYVLTYVFLPPFISSHFLPIVRIGNNDILNYINCAAYIQRLGPLNLVGYPLMGLGGFLVYESTPSAFYLIDILANFFNGEPMLSAMPALFGLVALTGCVTVRMTELIFRLPKLISVGLVAVIISGPFFRYIVGNYFLSQTIGTVIALLLLLHTAEILMQKRQKYSLLQMLLLTFTLFPYYFLFSYSYLSTLAIGPILQGIFVGFFCGLSLVESSLNWTNFLKLSKNLLGWLTAAFSALVLVILLGTNRFLELLAHAHRAIIDHAGWPLDLISPFAILGLPLQMTIAKVEMQLISLLIFVLLVGALAFFIFIRRRRDYSIIEKAFFLLSLAGFAIYLLDFFRNGSTYHAWKLASYAAMPFVFVIWAIFFKLISSPVQGLVSKRRLVNYGLILLCAGIISGNLIQQVFKGFVLDRFSSHYENLRALNMIAAPDIYIQMANYSSTFFPVYYIPNKQLHLLSQSYYSMETAPNPDEISPQKPLFIEGESCEGGGLQISISGVGCLFLSRPKGMYSFSQEIEGLSSTGLSGIEPWGRWSDGSKVTINLIVKKEEPSNGFLNFNIQPFLYGRAHSQRMVVHLGSKKIVTGVIGAAGWISLPYASQDLTGSSHNQLAINFDFPDALSPRDLNPAGLGDTRKLAIGFIELSLTQHPLGQVLT